MQEILLKIYKDRRRVTLGQFSVLSYCETPITQPLPARPPATRLAEIVLVNEIVGGAETAGYLLKYDSIHGTW